MKQNERYICKQAHGHGWHVGSSRSLRVAVKLALLACSSSLAASGAFAQETLPTGGQIVAGAGTIAASGNTMTVTQHTERMIADWHGFSIGAGHSVNFVQPGVSSVALNRVQGQDPSQILGSLNANGQVFLVNPNGVVVGRGAQVQAGSFVASTLDIANQDFLRGAYRFTGAGGAISNEGSLSGNVVALIAPTVVNDGSITGDAAFAAGTNVLLDFNGDGLLSVEVAASTVATLVENNGLIRADGGIAILTAKGASDALRGVVNNSGTVQARTLENRNGRILLLADMDYGDINVDGKLDASAPDSGDGGFIETSAQNVRIADDVHITTLAAAGEQGTWLIDPNDFTIAASGGNTTGNALSNVLRFTNVTISTATQGTPERNGDIFVNDAVSWSANTLTLQAERNIVINTAMNGSGTAGLSLWYGQGAPALNNSARYIVNAPINLAATGTFSTQLGNDGTLKNYTIISSLGNAASSNDGTLQGMRGNLAGNYVLGADIAAASTSSWNGGAGFTPIGGNGNASSWFSGTFDGLGHTIDGLYIYRPSTSYVGLFGSTYIGAVVRNVGIRDSTIHGLSIVGGLVGSNSGLIADSYSYRARGESDWVGGLVGLNRTLDGNNRATVIRSYATGGAFSFGTGIGGLVGRDFLGTIEQCHAAGEVSGMAQVGGLVGYSTGRIIGSHATGLVTGLGGRIGGLVGWNDGDIGNSYATGMVSGSTDVGGLVGLNGNTSDFSDAEIQQSYATGRILGDVSVGGLVGNSADGNVSDSFATGSVQGNAQVGGLIGSLYGWLDRSYATGAVISGASIGGGLVGHLVGGRVDASFYNNEISGRNAACGSIASGSCRGSGLTTQQMRDPFTFIDAGWDFRTIWGKSRSGENDNYMVLRALSGTEYEYYVRLSDVNLQRTYGDANPDLNGIALDGIGAGNVTLGWGSAISTSTGVGTYSLGGANVLNAQVNAGTAADYYFDYGSGSFTIDRAVLVGTVVGSSRTYDGRGFMGGHGINWSGFVAGDSESDLAGTLTYGGTAQGARNAGVYGITASGLSSGNYDITWVDGTLAIDPRVISLAGSRVYDGTTDVAAIALTLDNLVSGESLTLAGVGTLSDRNAGAGKSLSLGSLTLGDGSGLASNYTLASGAHFVDVERREIRVTAVAADNKVYDGTTAATLNLGRASFAGLVAGDDISVTSAMGAFGDKNVGTGKAVSVTGITLGGVDAGNYTLAGTSTNATSSITPREITAISGITADGKIYDRTTAASLNTATASFNGIVAGDVLSVASASGAFIDRNVGTNKIVDVTRVALSGQDAGNYILTNATATTTAAITPRTIAAVTGIEGNDKVYDGTTTATLDFNSANFVGMVAGDDIDVAGATGTFGDKNVGAGKTISVNGITLGGSDAVNYILADGTAITSAAITAREISAVSGITADGKVYDGTTAATLNTDGARFHGLIAGDALAVTSASGAFSDRNAGTDKTVNITGLELGGADVGNYVLVSHTSTTTASVTPRAITAITGITAVDKDYDGSTAAALDTRGASFVGSIAGDDLSVASARARFGSAEPAENATVYIAGLTLGGADAGNYALLNDAATATASISHVIVPPLQPEQTTIGRTDSVQDNMFPVPATSFWGSDPLLVDARGDTGRTSVSPLDPQSGTECTEPDDATKSHCADPPPSLRD